MAGSGKASYGDRVADWRLRVILPLRVGFNPFWEKVLRYRRDLFWGRVFGG